MSIIKMILLIGLLIFVHELGHFLVARLFKIKVERFCIGLPFGPVIFEKKIGDIVYGIHWLILGGYVSFPDDNKDNGLPEDSPELFKNRPIYQRVWVLLAGVTANFITAYLLVLFCCLHWHYIPSGSYEVTLNKISDKAKIEILNSDLKSGDKLISINGKEVNYPHELGLAAQMSKKFDNRITPNQYNKVLKNFLALNPDLNSESVLEKDQIVKLPSNITENPVILTKNDIYGLKSSVKYINLPENLQKIRNEAYGKKEYKICDEITLKDFIVAISDSYSPMNVTFLSDGKYVTVSNINTGEDGILGLEYSTKENINKTENFISAIKETNSYIAKNTYLMFWSLKMIVTGQVTMDNVQGIVGVTKIGSDIIQKHGLLRGFLLTALISLNLAILNLLPIPALDGGHLMFTLIEKIKGSPVDEKIIEKSSNIFFYLLIILMLIVVGHDIWAIWIKKLY